MDHQEVERIVARWKEQGAGSGAGSSGKSITSAALVTMGIGGAVGLVGGLMLGTSRDSTVNVFGAVLTTVGGIVVVVGLIMLLVGLISWAVGSPRDSNHPPQAPQPAAPPAEAPLAEPEGTVL